MSVPGIVESELDDESIAARIPLSGGDEAFVTPSRTLVYRGEGLLSDESVDEFDHDVDRLSVVEDRRKTQIRLEYPDADRSIAVPEDRVQTFLEPLVAGVLRARNVTAPDERIAGAFRFSELTLVVTSERFLKNVGEAVWDDTYEAFHFDDVTGLEYEEGSVATQIVLTVDGRKQRIKTPNDRTPKVREALESALRAYHNVTSIEELPGESEEADADEEEDSVVTLDDDIDPLTPDEDDGSGTPGDEAEAGAAATPSERSDATGGAGGDAGTADAGGTPEGADVAAGTGTDEAAGTAGTAGTAGGGGTATDAGSEVASGAGSEGATGAGSEEATDAGSEGATGDGATASATEAASASGVDAGSENGTGSGEAADSSDDASDDDGFPFTETLDPVEDDSELREEVEDLRAAVERQNELLAEQQRTLEELVDALREK